MKRRTASLNRLFCADAATLDASVTVSTPRWQLCVGWRLLLTLGLSSLAFIVRSPQAVAVVGLLNLLWVWLCGVPWCSLRALVKPFMLQTLLLVSLYLLQQGQGGLFLALQVSCQMMLTMVPGLVLMVCVPSSQLTKSLSRWLPDQAAFVLASSLHFFPLVMAELRTLYQMQLLRGAPLSIKDVWRPWNWLDVARCLVVPGVVLAMAMAHEIAMAARARNFSSAARSCWPEE